VGPNESSIAFYNLIHVVACQVDEERNGSWVKLFLGGGVGYLGGSLLLPSGTAS